MAKKSSKTSETHESNKAEKVADINQPPEQLDAPKEKVKNPNQKSPIVDTLGKDIYNEKLKERFISAIKKSSISPKLINIFADFLIIGIVAIPVVALIYQTFLLSWQNRLLQNQNSRLEQQTYLLEADRRSALVFELSTIFNKIGEEVTESNSRSLSPTLIGRIVAISRSFKPYRYLADNGELISHPISPERGQLLISLVNSKLDTSTIKEIFLKGDFSKSDLRGVNLDGAYIPYINFEGADLSYVQMSNSNLFKANLKNANLAHSTIKDALLNGAIMQNVILDSSDLQSSCIKGALLDNSSLISVNLSNSFIYEVNFNHTDLSYTNFSDAVLRGVTWTSSKLDKVNFSHAIVFNKDWFAELEQFYKPISGVTEIKKKYLVDISTPFESSRLFAEEYMGCIDFFEGHGYKIIEK